MWVPAKESEKLPMPCLPWTLTAIEQKRCHPLKAHVFAAKAEDKRQKIANSCT